jgi:hypothetical protein
MVFLREMNERAGQDLNRLERVGRCAEGFFTILKNSRGIEKVFIRPEPGLRGGKLK